MAGEDFAFIGRAVPACFLFLGTRNESVGAGACACSLLWVGCAQVARPVCGVWGCWLVHCALPSPYLASCPPLPTRLASCPAVHGLHTPRFTLDEGVLPLGAALHTALATQYMEQWHARQQQGSATAAREEL